MYIARDLTNLLTEKISDLLDTAIEERSNLFGFMGSVNGKPRGEMVDALQNHDRCGT